MRTVGDATLGLLLLATACSAGHVGGGPRDGSAGRDLLVTADRGLPDQVPAPDSCVPACTGKDCGDDGCGGTCGSCGSGTACDEAGTCEPICPCWDGACLSCYCGTALTSYGTAHGCVVPKLAGNTGDLFSCGGSTTGPGSWSVGTTCADGCTVAPPMVPDYCDPPPSAGHRLWIAFDAGTATCSGATDTFFNCVFGHSSFDSLAVGYSTGRSYSSVAGYQVLGKPCTVTHDACCATTAGDEATLQCIEDQTGWMVGTDDMVLYYPTVTTPGTWNSCNGTSHCGGYGGGCQDGRNHWHIPVTRPDKSMVSVEMAFAFTGASCNCQTALGTHEVYEAASEASAADCCNGQTWTGCPAGGTPSPWGWYSASGCGQTWELQTVSPAGEEYNAAYCTKLTFK